jgi:DNA-binding winged helix-turn-helix (wHTH) protein
LEEIVSSEVSVIAPGNMSSVIARRLTEHGAKVVTTLAGPTSPIKVFAGFRLDTPNQCLWRAGGTGAEERILLTPKTFEVLAYLVEHAGRLVTHDELLKAVWSNCVIEPQAVRRNVRALRSALGDRPKNSLFIETIPKRGYRFIAPVLEAVSSSPIVSSRPTQDLVGRGGALEVLHATWQRALSGERQIVFVTGEPGIGKTPLVEEFQRQVALRERTVHIAHGQCIEGYGSKEAYGPMLVASLGNRTSIQRGDIHTTASHSGAKGPPFPDSRTCKGLRLRSLGAFDLTVVRAAFRLCSNCVRKRRRDCSRDHKRSES